jgi:hypothetical protein
MSNANKCEQMRTISTPIRLISTSTAIRPASNIAQTSFQLQFMNIPPFDTLSNRYFDLTSILLRLRFDFELDFDNRLIVRTLTIFPHFYATLSGPASFIVLFSDLGPSYNSSSSHGTSTDVVEPSRGAVSLYGNKSYCLRHKG